MIAHDGEWARDSRVHGVSVERDSRLAAALGASEITVNSMHHQALDQAAPGLRVVATAPDGVVEGAEWADDDWWMVGAQWHPEELTASADPWDRALFSAFAAAVRAHGG